jgi:hypothetical protein
LPYFAAIECLDLSNQNQSANAAREPETCVISTPCCAFAISMPR